MGRGPSPRTVAVRGLADAVVQAVELGDDCTAEAAAEALLGFMTALRRGQQAS